jgi:hypothetical protein
LEEISKVENKNPSKITKPNGSSREGTQRISTFSKNIYHDHYPKLKAQLRDFVVAKFHYICEIAKNLIDSTN